MRSSPATAPSANAAITRLAMRCAALILALAVAPPAARAQRAAGSPTAEVFRRYADRVIKIHVVETSSAAKAELGTGFFVSANGHIVTNYHVVAEIIHDPDRYRADWIDAASKPHRLRILAVDVVHDLAILQTDRRPAAFFTLAPVDVPQGTRLYALGHPNDLGLSIVEGTDNGLLPNTLYPQIHFTGAINPGMSGGPAITADGRVVGINVATEGDGIGFLVPVDPAVALLRTVLAPGFAPPTSFLADIGAQLRANQDRYLANLFTDSTPTVTLGAYQLPTRPKPFFRCWADASRHDAEHLYDVITHRCSTDDDIYLWPDQSTGSITFMHRLYTSAGLGRVRFFALYEKRFEEGMDSMDGDERDVTRFSCQTRNVRHGAITMRAVLCLRRYRHFAGLYDAVLKAAILGGRDSGVLTTLTLTGVSFANATRITRRYLERVTATRASSTDLAGTP